MKRFIFIWLIIGIWAQGVAQVNRTRDSLNHIINDKSINPENRIITSIHLGEYYINKPGSYTKDIDSAITCLKQGQQIKNASSIHSMDGELLFLQGLIEKEKGNRPSGDRINNQALLYLRKGNDKYFLGSTLLAKGDYLNTDDNKQLDEKIALLNEAITYFTEKKYTKTRAATWKSLGDLYGLEQDYKKYTRLALDAYQHSMDAYLSTGYTNIQDIYVELANIYKSLGDDQLGLQYCLKAVQIAEK